MEMRRANRLFFLLVLCVSLSRSGVRGLRAKHENMEGQDTRKIVIFQYGDQRYLDDYKLWVDCVQKYAQAHSDYDYVMVNLDNATQASALLEDPESSPAKEKSLSLRARQTDKDGRTVDTTAKYEKKPAMILAQMAKMNEGDWLVYMDLDVCVADPARRIESILKAADPTLKGDHLRRGIFPDNPFAGKPDPPQGCDFIAQDHGITVNSGLLFFRVGDNSRHLLNLWINEVRRIGGTWTGDQGPLMSTVLKLAASHTKALGGISGLKIPGLKKLGLSDKPNYKNQCDPHGGTGKWPPTGSDWGAMVKVAKGKRSWKNLNGAREEVQGILAYEYSNFCYNETMTFMGLREDQRKFANYCLLNHDKTQRVNLHQSDGWGPGNDYMEGDFAYHQKERTIVEKILSTWDDRLAQRVVEEGSKAFVASPSTQKKEHS